MPKTAVLLAAALVLAVAGFALGYSIAAPSESDVRAMERRPVEDTPATTDRELNPILPVLREPDSFARLGMLAKLLPMLGAESTPLVEAALKSREFDLGVPETELLVRAWARGDPSNASAWAFGSPLAYRPAAINAATEEWARIDPQAAVEDLVAMAIVRPQFHETAQKALVRGWVQAGLPGVLEYTESLFGIDQQRALATYAREIARRDGPEAIMRWAESLSDDNVAYKLAAFRAVGSEVASLDPNAAVIWCEAHCEGPYGGTLRDRIANRWAMVDGRAAMDWLSRGPDGKARDLAVKSAYRSWGRSDPPGLRAWLGELTPEEVEPWLLPAVELYAPSLAARPLEALEWAALIEDPEIRERVYVTIARSWRRIDAAAVDAWLEDAPLSEEAREIARQPLPTKEAQREQRRREQLERREKRRAGEQASAAPAVD